MSSPGSPLPQGGGSTPTAKGKEKKLEKKRVGFSAGDGTPLKEEQGFNWGPAPPEPAASRPPPLALPADDQPPHDGIDGNELSRALSRILQENGEPHPPPAVLPTAPPAAPAASLLAVPPLPGPAYFPYERQQQSERAAKERADRLAQSVERANSTPVSRATSIDGDSEAEDDTDTGRHSQSALYQRRLRRSTVSAAAFNDPDDPDDPDLERGRHSPAIDQTTATALHLVRSHTFGSRSMRLPPHDPGHDRSEFHYDAALSAGPDRSGPPTPTALYDRDGHDYVPPPSKYSGGILSSLLRLYNNSNSTPSGSSPSSVQSTPGGTPASSRPPSPSALDTGSETPKRLSGLFHIKHKNDKQDKQPASPSLWKHQRYASSSTSLSTGLLGTSSMLASAGSADIGHAVTERVKRERPPLKRNKHSGSLFGVGSPKTAKPRKDAEKSSRRRREEEQYRITIHIAHVLSRHRYLTKLCRALMMYGAPTHRLEDYLKMSSRVLEIEAQFLYIPGCMLVSFDDSSTHTAEVKLVRAPQGVDLGKLDDVHIIYKEVVHDLISVDEASARLDAVINRKNKYKLWLRIPVYGLASVCVAPFAFEGRFIDLPVAFLLGCIVGLLALVAAPSSAMYSNVFEISAAVITSFIARAFGSINGGKTFCFSALAQSSIALILPGYMVLCSSLELQSQNIVAGSVRMVYAMIYTLFLGYGITIGSAVYGAIDHNATSNTTCSNPLTRPWYFLFVPLFTICLCIINQAKVKQIPVMVFISVAGFAVNTYASQRFSSNAQISNTLGALTIGVVANLYSRLSRYLRRFVVIFWAKYLLPFLRRIRPQKRGRQWQNVRSTSSSRQTSQTNETLPDGYFDLPPYRKEHVAAAAADSRARENRDHGEEVVAEVAAEVAAAAEAERKAPGSNEVMGYGLAAAAMLPAIFVQVPSGLAVNGSLLSGLNAANELTGTSSGSDGTNNVAFSVLYSVIQVAIGITVGLFLSALIVYPLGKRRSALFSF